MFFCQRAEGGGVSPVSPSKASLVVEMAVLAVICEVRFEINLVAVTVIEWG